LAFALSTSLICGILLVYSINPYWICTYLLAGGLFYPIWLFSPYIREEIPWVGLIISYFQFSLAAGILAFYYAFS
jgi:hypothetical protein